MPSRVRRLPSLTWTATRPQPTGRPITINPSSVFRCIHRCCEGIGGGDVPQVASAAGIAGIYANASLIAKMHDKVLKTLKRGDALVVLKLDPWAAQFNTFPTYSCILEMRGYRGDQRL